MVRKPKRREYQELDVVGPLHKLRWTMHKHQGMAIEDIAAEQGVSPAMIRQSIARVEASIQACTLDEAARLQFEKIRTLHRIETDLLVEAGRATIPIILDGKIVRDEPDHKTRLAAFDSLTARLAAVQPRSKGVEITQSKQELHLHSAAASAAAEHAKGKSFEDILRKIDSSQRQLPMAAESSVLLEVQMEKDDQPIEDEADDE